ncbi:MAG TPA: hypothetical protein VMT02_00075 [Burkholderiales bacterium]|nr:hypothetical protein [Burkholderiales bacterium]
MRSAALALALSLAGVPASAQQPVHPAATLPREPLTSVPQTGSPAVVPSQDGPKAPDKPRGVYAAIEIRSQQSTIARLRQLVPVPRREAISAALANPASLSPPALYALANAISQDDANIDQAVFWYHVARIRAVYDALRCKDATARYAVNIFGRNLNPDVARYQRQHRPRTLVIAQLALEWDDANPRDYDYRWINLYGKVARESDGADPSELTVPEAEWPAILAHVHAAHLQSVRAFAASETKN